MVAELCVEEWMLSGVEQCREATGFSSGTEPEVRIELKSKVMGAVTEKKQVEPQEGSERMKRG